jgi:hypothetical protein
MELENEVNFDRILSLIEEIQQQHELFFQKLLFFYKLIFRDGSFVVSFPFEEASKTGKEILKNINLLNSLLEESNLKIGETEIQSKISLSEISKNIKEALESKTIY